MTVLPSSYITPLPLVPCPHCGVEVPDAHFCGACGAHFHAEKRRAARRYHAYAAFPEEPVIRLAITTSLFPHLSHHTKNLFRAATAGIALLLVVLAIWGAEAPLIAVASLGFPLLFVLYLFEIDGPEKTSLRVPVGAALLVGGILGVGWGEIGSHFVNEALSPSLNASPEARCNSITTAIVVPLAGVVLTSTTALIVRTARARRLEALDGFVIGAGGALGFVLTAAIVQLSSLLRGGQLSQLPFTNTVTLAIIRGLTVPVTAAVTIGLVGCTLWVQRRDNSPSQRRWLTLPAAAVGFAALLQVGLGFADLANLVDSELLVVHLAAMAVAILGMRLALHHTLLHERHDPSVGVPYVCAHCHHAVPLMQFCPQCGIARHATSPGRRGRLDSVNNDVPAPGSVAP